LFDELDIIVVGVEVLGGEVVADPRGVDSVQEDGTGSVANRRLWGGGNDVDGAVWRLPAAAAP
jgi:hypothetical protein